VRVVTRAAAPMLWNIVDNRDIPESPRLITTSDIAGNGSRYMLASTDASGEFTVEELVETLRKLYPDIDVTGDYIPPPTPDRPHAKCTNAITELGLQTHRMRDMLRATVDSLIDVAGVIPKMR
jgi:hypothetical protein